MKQDYQRIEEKIEQFFEGKSSNEEEQELFAFFSSENVPEHLLQYCQVFAYFETGIKEEESNRQIDLKNTQLFRKRKISFWVSIAASLLLLISFGIYHFNREKDFKLYEESYIIRNGVKITDPKIVNPEIKKTLYLAQQQEKEFEQLLLSLQEISLEDPHEQIVREIEQQQLIWVEEIEDETIRNEILEILNLEL